MLKNDPEPRSKITDIQQLSERLIKENILPELTVELLKHVVQYRQDHITLPALGAAYLLNEQYDEALAQFSASLKQPICMSEESSVGAFPQVQVRKYRSYTTNVSPMPANT